MISLLRKMGSCRSIFFLPHITHFEIAVEKNQQNHNFDDNYDKNRNLIVIFIVKIYFFLNILIFYYIDNYDKNLRLRMTTSANDDYFSETIPGQVRYFESS